MLTQLAKGVEFINIFMLRTAFFVNIFQRKKPLNCKQRKALNNIFVQKNAAFKMLIKLTKARYRCHKYFMSTFWAQ
jgi:hypothetical protein